MKDNLGIIFIHGAGLGNYIWDDLQPQINWSSLMVEYPNRNADDNANSKLSFNDYAAKVISDIENFGKQNLIIVTHSIGGIIGLEVAAHFKNRIIGFVGISSAIPKSGNSFISCLPFPQKFIVPIILKLAGTKPPKSAIIKGLCSDLNPSQTKKVVENFTPESINLYTEKTKSKIPNTKKLYVELSNDKEFPVSVQKKMAENLNCREIVTLESGHLPMISIPEKLAEVLNGFIAACVEED